jgi:hypothetical protein
LHCEVIVARSQVGSNQVWCSICSRIDNSSNGYMYDGMMKAEDWHVTERPSYASDCFFASHLHTCTQHGHLLAALMVITR